MARGSRPGERRGGRKKGTPNKATQKRREIAIRALEEGVTPLDVMLRTMRALWAKAELPNGKLDIAAAKEAAEIAKDAAPFVHPRLAAVVARVNDPSNTWCEILDLVEGKSRGLPVEASRRAAGAGIGRSKES